MIGAIIGDICGSVYEWHNEKDINRVKLFARGCYPTDDSVMTVAVARALMDSMGESDAKARTLLIDSMHYFGHVFPHAGYGGRFSQWLKRSERESYNSWGNGAGMRVAAIGWLYNSIEEVLKYARMSAEVTHSHPEGIKGAQAIAACVYLARMGAGKEEIREYVEDNFYRLDFTIDEIRPSYHFDVSCQGSCPQAIEAFLESESFEHAIKLAISVGGDSDTIAAMTGAMAEAFYGVPEEMMEKAFEVLKDCRTYQGYFYRNSILKEEYYRFCNKYCRE